MPLKRRIADTSALYDNALAVFAEFSASGSSRVRQLFGVFNVRDGRLAAIWEPRELEHRMRAPTSIDDGQTLLCGAQSETGLYFDCVLDVQSGMQRAIKVDSLGQPVESATARRIWVRSSEQM